jgi:hypothetical protein
VRFSLFPKQSRLNSTAANLMHLPLRYSPGAAIAKQDRMGGMQCQQRMETIRRINRIRRQDKWWSTLAYANSKATGAEGYRQDCTGAQSPVFSIAQHRICSAPTRQQTGSFLPLSSQSIRNRTEPPRNDVTSGHGGDFELSTKLAGRRPPTVNDWLTDVTAIDRSPNSLINASRTVPMAAIALRTTTVDKRIHSSDKAPEVEVARRRRTLLNPARQVRFPPREHAGIVGSAIDFHPD